jgi:hypothetical protein
MMMQQEKISLGVLPGSFVILVNLRVRQEPAQ